VINTIENRKQATPELEHVRVSQATREMAKPATHEVRLYSQEYDDLVEKKRRLEQELASINDGLLKKNRITLLVKGHTYDNTKGFHAERVALLERRNELVREKTGVEKRMMFIKSKAREERMANNKAQQQKPQRALADTVDELRKELDELKRIVMAMRQ
jgi:hypothetical protein